MSTASTGTICAGCAGRIHDCAVCRIPGLRHLQPVVQAVGRRTCTILIQGETGVGKEVLARHIHATGPRRQGPFVAVDCTGLRDTLFESQLFGHVKGAFTGAGQTTLGFFRAADGGTLFLDEIGELGLQVQAKLLRCIQDRAVVPLGGVEPVPVDVRIIAATHRDLEAMVARGEFRQDLYYRLNVVRIRVPALRDRVDDIPILAQHFLERFAMADGRPARRLSPDAVEALRRYAWPGNVRELANAMEQADIFATGGMVTVADLPEELRSSPIASVKDRRSNWVTLEAAERAVILDALRATGGNQSRAAALLDIDRRRLYRKVRRYGLAKLVH